MNTLTIYRNSLPSVTVDIDEKTVFIQKLMAEHRISSEFTARGVLDIQIGDYITHNLENFYLNRIPSITKINSTTFQYRLDFESVWYDLKKKLFISIDGLAEYGRTGNASDFITDIVTNMNVNYTGWSVGTVDSTEEKTLVFSNETCASALIKVAETFGLEFGIETKSISLVASIGSTTSYVFEYGKNKGMYKLDREQVSDQNIVTRVFGFGSSANIPYTYRDRAKRLVFEERFLEKNTGLYGIIEGQYTNDDIYPNRTGSISGVNMEFEGDVFNARDSYIEDTSVSGFDINNYIISGLDPLIVFKTGDLSGQEFVIWKYDPVNFRIHFQNQSDEDGYTTPNPLNVPIVGDLYTLVNIALPQSYIDDAELALKNATQAYLDENSVPMVVYSVDIDPKFSKTNTVILKAGDRVTIIDTQLGMNTAIRVSGITYPLTNVYKVKATIADFVPYTQQERVVKAAISNITETRIVDRSSDEMTRRNAMRQRQLNELIFDSDGYFDGTRIRPLSVETMYLSVGARSQNFRLSGVRIKPNWNGEMATPNAIWISAGELHHFEVPEEGEYIWIIGSSAIFYDLVPTSAYYLYARCNKQSHAGIWELTTAQLAADGEDGNYHFLVGILYAVYEDWRDFDFTYGMTYINGRTITTGRIQTLNESNYLDLDQNSFRVGDLTHSLSWNENADGRLVLTGTLIQRTPTDDPFPIMLFRGVYSPVITYHRGDIVTYGGTTWIYNSEISASGITPVEGAYWTAQSATGAAGADGASPFTSFRGNWAVGTDYYGNATRVDIVFNEFDSLYYVAKIRDTANPFKGLRPDLYPDLWTSFGANFENVATGFLFAENAHIAGLSVELFEGSPVGVGDLSGTVATTAPDHVHSGTPTNRIDFVAITGTSGSANITCNGVTRGISWQGNVSDTLAYFYDHWYVDYYQSGVMIEPDEANDRMLFIGVLGDDFIGDTTGVGDLALDCDTVTQYVEGAKQVETITLTGTGGSAWILCDGQTKKALFADTLTLTASSFVTANYAFYFARDIILSSDGEKIRFEARYQGRAFTGATSITNNVSSYAGGINIEGNEIWDDKTSNDLHGTILMNLKGYNGGLTYFRNVCIGDGKGTAVVSIGGNPSYSGNGHYINADAATIHLWNLPVSSNGSGIATDQIYRTPDGDLKIKN